MPRCIFVTATDTDAGKTWVTKSLLQQSLSVGKDIQALKPIASGVDERGRNEDVATLLSAQPDKMEHDINFATFDLPLAPALAARRQGGCIAKDRFLAWQHAQLEKHDITLIEGVGGLMVPLIQEPMWLVSDWLQGMADAEVLLVVPLRLGCMNQVLLSCYHLQHIGKPPQWIVFNDMEHTGTFDETYQTIQPFLQYMLDELPHIVSIGYGEAMPNLW